jgi:peptide/nickel transport system substrate-binding protein
MPVAIDPTPIPPPPKTLVVCLDREPESLFIYSDAYLFGETGGEARAVLEAIYDGPIDIVDYRAFPVILGELPSFEGGGARLEEVTLAEYEVYLNPETLQPANLRLGNPYLPVGCTGVECIKSYPGGEVQMERLVVEFQLLPDLTWSDGEPLTASDSLFSFELDSDRTIPTTKYLVDRTAAYEVIDETTVRWIGIPGYIDPEYPTLLWKPLPQHLLGDIALDDLQNADLATRSPIGWGPYQIEEWQSGEQLLLAKNLNYFRTGEGLPGFDRLLFRFLQSDSTAAIQQLLTGECDLVDESLLDVSAAATLKQYAGEGRFQVAWAPASEITRLDFNVAPVGRFGEMFFAELRARKALTQCIDREALLTDVLLGFGVLPDTYLAPGNPVKGDGPGLPLYDPDAGRALLTEVGWIDTDDDEATPRVAYGVPGVAFGTEFSVTLLTAEGDLNDRIAAIIQANLAVCGVEVQVEAVDFSSLTAPYPDGPVFGRGFDAVLWSWPEWITPLCEMFAERELPTEKSPFGVNATGFNDLVYNRACERVLLGRVDNEAYLQALLDTQDIFVQALPGIPLYQAPRFVAYNNDICGIEVDSLSFSVLFGLEHFDTGAGCP